MRRNGCPSDTRAFLRCRLLLCRLQPDYRRGGHRAAPEEGKIWIASAGWRRSSSRSEPSKRLLMISWTSRTAIKALAIALPSMASSSSADQIARGHQLALEICSACHLAASDQKAPPILSNPPPSLQTIADRPATSATSVRNFLLSIHLSLANGKDMPNPLLTEDQANDLAAHVMSLRKAKE